MLLAKKKSVNAAAMKNKKVIQLQSMMSNLWTKISLTRCLSNASSLSWSSEYLGIGDFSRILMSLIMVVNRRYAHVI